MGEGEEDEDKDGRKLSECQEENSFKMAHSEHVDGSKRRIWVFRTKMVLMKKKGRQEGP